MTTPKLLMFCGFVLIVGTLASHFMAGTFFGSTEQTWMDSLTVIRTYNVLGLFTIPWINPDFFTVGIPRLVSWDFGFFGGDYAIMQYFFYVITIGVAWGFFVVAIGVISSFWRR